MYVIAVASQKGGSGKTTLAGHLAVQADRSGAGPVALVDTDPQGSLAEWWNARTAETPLFARTGAERLAEDIARMASLGIRTLGAVINGIRDEKYGYGYGYDYKPSQTGRVPAKLLPVPNTPLRTTEE